MSLSFRRVTVANALIGGAIEVKTRAQRMIDAAASEPREFTALECLEGALDWWREAGVDADFVDEPRGWLVDPEATDAVAAPAPVVPAPIQRKTPLQRALERPAEASSTIGQGQLPSTLEKFREFWMTEPALAAGPPERRAAPRGAPGAAVMFLLAQPAADDDGDLLSGALGKFASAILGAMKIGEAQAYLASALPIPNAVPDWDRFTAEGFGAVTRQHIALAAPTRVVAFGRAQLKLFGIAPEAARDPLSLECGDRTVSLLAAPDLRNLARSAVQRQNFWNRWLDWTR